MFILFEGVCTSGMANCSILDQLHSRCNICVVGLQPCRCVLWPALQHGRCINSSAFTLSQWVSVESTLWTNGESMEWKYSIRRGPAVYPPQYSTSSSPFSKSSYLNDESISASEGYGEPQCLEREIHKNTLFFLPPLLIFVQYTWTPCASCIFWINCLEE